MLSQKQKLITKIAHDMLDEKNTLFNTNCKAHEVFYFNK